MVLSFFEVGVSSCTKDHNIYDTVTVIKKDTVTVIRKDTVTVKDTVTIKDTMLTAEILTANQWIIQKFIGVYGGDSIFYLRGGINNTNNYDDEYLSFNSDGTGYSQDPAGYGHLIGEWHFTNDEHTQLTFKYYVTNSPIYHLITWDNIRYKNKGLMYDEYYHDNYVDKNAHEQVIRVPK